MKQVDVIYLRADRSIEKYKSNIGQTIFIYNDQGLYFDVFFSESKMNDFLNDKSNRGDLFFNDEKLINEYFNFNR